MLASIIETILFIVSFAFMLMIAIDLIGWSYSGNNSGAAAKLSETFTKSMVDLPIKLIIIVINIVLYLVEAVINLVLALTFMINLTGKVEISKLKYEDYA